MTVSLKSFQIFTFKSRILAYSSISAVVFFANSSSLNGSLTGSLTSSLTGSFDSFCFLHFLFFLVGRLRRLKRNQLGVTN